MFVVAGLLFILINDYFTSNFMVVFSILYLAQFLIALVFISILDKSRSQLYLPIYFIVAMIVYAILFIKLV